MNINLKQAISIIIAILGVLMVSSANLTDLFGAQISKLVVSTAAMLNSILGATLAVITSQTGTVKDVLAMEGVEKITVNQNANQTLASVAVDPKQGKIAPKLGQEDLLESIAKGT